MRKSNLAEQSLAEKDISSNPYEALLDEFKYREEQKEAIGSAGVMLTVQDIYEMSELDPGDIKLRLKEKKEEIIRGMKTFTKVITGRWLNGEEKQFSDRYKLFLIIAVQTIRSSIEFNLERARKRNDTDEIRRSQSELKKIDVIKKEYDRMLKEQEQVTPLSSDLSSDAPIYSSTSTSTPS